MPFINNKNWSGLNSSKFEFSEEIAGLYKVLNKTERKIMNNADLWYLFQAIFSLFALLQNWPLIILFLNQIYKVFSCPLIFL